MKRKADVLRAAGVPEDLIETVLVGLLEQGSDLIDGEYAANLRYLATKAKRLVLEAVPGRYPHEDYVTVPRRYVEALRDAVDAAEGR